jgi:hypothetical protein
MRNARGRRTPAPLRLLLVLHLKAQATVPHEPTKPVDRDEAPIDQLHAERIAGPYSLALRARGRFSFTLWHRIPSLAAMMSFRSTLSMIIYAGIPQMNP